MTNSHHTHQALPKQNNLMGILYMIMHTGAIATLYAVMKKLTNQLDSNLVVFLYKFSILIFIIPWCFARGFKSMKTEHIWLHASRGFFSVLGALCLFYAIKHIHLSDITAIQHLEYIIVLIIGIVYFKEKVTLTKIAVVIISFIGALFIVRPDLFDQELAITHTFYFNHYYIFVFMALSFWAMNSTVIKILGKTEKTKVQLFYVMLFSSILAAPTAFMEWTTFTHLGHFEIKLPSRVLSFAELKLKTEHIPYIAALALCYFIHAITHFKAFKHAEISMIIPFEYTKLVYAGIFGFIFFQERPTNYEYFGYTLITIAGLLLIDAEKRRLKRAKAEVLEKEYEE